ncbi:putative RDD family membrane protein YckC [Streptomyces sp. TLI_171]|nr:putative RDD family membrane protein YckC [Streptomyces sp. TLI_171]
MTGEAVVLGLRTARLPSRALAQLLDWFAYGVGFFFSMVALAIAMRDLEEAAADAFAIAALVFFLVLLPVLIETLSHGRSLGKAAMGLRVVRADGGPIRFRHALVRGVIGVLEFGLSAVPAVLSSLFSTNGRRLGDIFGGTMVIRERLPQSARDQGRVPPVPPQVMHALGADLVALDLTAVPDGLWQSSRQLLGRMHELDQSVAAGLADRLAADVAQRTGWPVPAGLPPMVYLGAVLMERQRRAWGREQERAAAAYAAVYGSRPGAVPVAAAPTAPFAVPVQAAPPAAPAAPTRTLGYPAAPAPPAPAAAGPVAPQAAPVAPQDAVVAPQPEAAPVAPPAGGGFAPPA